MVTTIISGGQTGADQAGLRAGKALGLSTGGWVPLGWKTDDGPAPWLADYGCLQHSSTQYAPRTIANVRQADTLIWFGDPTSPGGRLTLAEAVRSGVPLLPLRFPELDPYAELLRDFLRHPDGTLRPLGVLLIAGNRERTNPGIGAFVERVLREALK